MSSASPTLPAPLTAPISSIPSTPKIAIIGTGPAGLTLAAILTRHAIPYTLYESSASARNQGGTLDLHPQGGQAALRYAGLWEEFLQHARPESDVLKVLRLDGGEMLWDGNTGEDKAMMDKKKKEEGGERGGEGEKGEKAEKAVGERPEIDRAILCSILLKAVESGAPGAVKWGKKLLEVTPHDANKWALRFSDGTVEEDFDLVVGADGAWSRVRAALTDLRPEYSGVVCLELWGTEVQERHPWMAEFVGEGSCFAFGEGRTVQIQRVGDGSVRTYACLRTPREGFWGEEYGGVDFTQEWGGEGERGEEKRREFVERWFEGCGEGLKRMVVESGDGVVARTLYQLPVGCRWEGRGGVTLVGDAAHLMTPFAGVGVNVAMVDAMELGREVVGFVERGGSLTDVVREYEEGLFPRGEACARKTMGNLKKHFSEGGSEELAARLRAGYGGGN